MPPQNLIQLLYVTYFDRAADQSGLTYWQSRLEKVETFDDIRTAFANPDVAEIQAQYAQAATGDAYISAMYQHLLNREPDASGLAYWNDRLAQTLDEGTPLQTAGLALQAAFLDAAMGQAGIDANTLNAKAALANTITSTAGNDSEALVQLSDSYLDDPDLGSYGQAQLGALKAAISASAAPDHSPEQPDTTVLNLDALTSTDLKAATADADDGIFRFEDSALTQSNTQILHFGPDDSLLLHDITAEDVRVHVANDATHLQFDDQNGVVSQVELVGVSGFYTSVEAFNQDSTTGDILFA